MARIYEPTEKQLKRWKKWVKSRPPVVRRLAARFTPWTLYRLGDNRVQVTGYNEDGTVSVDVSGKFNFVMFERNVFGVDPDELTECDLPAEGESLGVAISNPTEEDFAAMRAAMGIRRKDLQ